MAQDQRISTPIGDAAEFFQLALGLSALEHHAVERLLARDLDLHAFGKRIGDGDTDPVQAARRPVHARVEFAARVQGAHDHFERGLLREFWMRVDGNAAAVVGDGNEAIGFHFDFDERGVPFERLVHGIVDHLGEEMMQRLLVGAADIHAGPASHRLQAFQHLDVACRVAGLGPVRRPAGPASPGSTAGRFGQIREQVSARSLGGGPRCCLGGLGHVSQDERGRKERISCNYATGMAA